MIRGWRMVATAALAGAVGAGLLAGGPPVPASAGIHGRTVTNLLWLPVALRKAGLYVAEEPGWRGRGHSAPMRARAVMLHHDASPAGPSPDVARYLAGGFASGSDRHYDAQVWVDSLGRWHMVAAGSAQHAGDGGGWGAIRTEQGNVDSFGVETDHTVGERWPPEQLDSIRRGLAAICAAAGWDPAVSVVAHREYAPARKSDPDGVDMRRLRQQVAELA